MKKRLVCYAFLMVSLIASSPAEAGPSVGVESALPVPVDFRPPEIIPAPKKLNFRSDVPVPPVSPPAASYYLSPPMPGG